MPLAIGALWNRVGLVDRTVSEAVTDRCHLAGRACELRVGTAQSPTIGGEDVAGVDEGAVIVREDVLATSIEEAEARAFEATCASLLDEPLEDVFARDVETSVKGTKEPQTSAEPIEDGPSPFQQRGL